MIFHADSESDLKTTPNQVKNQILSKIIFLWYFDLTFSEGRVLRIHPAYKIFDFQTPPAPPTPQGPQGSLGSPGIKIWAPPARPKSIG